MANYCVVVERRVEGGRLVKSGILDCNDLQQAEETCSGLETAQHNVTICVVSYGPKGRLYIPLDTIREVTEDMERTGRTVRNRDRGA